MKTADTAYIPTDSNLENLLLGSILIYPESFTTEVRKVLKEEYFTSKQNRKIFSLISELSSQSKSYDIETIIGTLKTNDFEQKKSLALYLVQLENNAPLPSCIFEYSLILSQSHIRRAVIESSYANISKAQDFGIDELQLLEDATRPLLKINEHLSKANATTESEAIDEIRKEVIEIMNSGVGIKGIKTFIPSLDNRLGGLGKGRMITIAGRPGSGKTALVVQIATNICLNKKNLKLPVVFYTLEMTSKELIYRFASCLIGYPYTKLERAEMDNDKANNFWRALDYIQNSNLRIVDNLHDLSLIIADIKAKKANGECEVAIIDYMQLVTPPKGKSNQSREQDVSSISRMIKIVAKELQLPILALSQLNRETEKRQSKKPQLSDLRESGSIEQDSDSVTFTYRPKYAGFDKDDNGGDVSENEAWLITAKNRHGAAGEDELYCDISCNVFTEPKGSF